MSPRRTRVLVRAPSWLGDFVAAEPVLRALHARRAAGELEQLTIAAPAPCLALVERALAGATLLPTPRGATPDPTAWRGHDLALLLDGSLRSAWCAVRAGIPERAGWSGGGRAALLTLGVRPALERGGVPFGIGRAARTPRRLPRPFAAACRELAALACSRVAGFEVADVTPRLTADPAALERARARLAKAGIDARASFALVNAGARPGSAKGADPRVLAAACDALAIPCVLACAPGEEQLARDARGLCGRGAVLFDDPPSDLAELVALITLSAVVLTPDSGPRHLAQALGRPVVVLCGPTDPRHTAEHPANVRVLSVPVDCGPCHRERCLLEGDLHHACMRRIDPAAVASAARALLARHGA